MMLLEPVAEGREELEEEGAERFFGQLVKVPVGLVQSSAAAAVLLHEGYSAESWVSERQLALPDSEEKTVGGTVELGGLVW